MNVTFRTGNEELDAKFVSEATAAGFVNLKVGGMRGHRKVGWHAISLHLQRHAKRGRANSLREVKR